MTAQGIKQHENGFFSNEKNSKDVSIFIFWHSVKLVVLFSKLNLLTSLK